MFAAPLCAAQSKCTHKDITCLEKQCITKLREMFALLDKKYKDNIAVHQENLKQFQTQLKNTNNKKEVKQLIATTKEYLKMYTSYGKLTTEYDKVKWFTKYFMT